MGWKSKSSARAQHRYREATPEYRETEAMRVKARYRAMSALARKHPAEFGKLYEAELEKLRESK